MEYRALGTTGVQVSPLCLGTMAFGAWGNSDHEDAIKIIRAALDAGINFVDTADVYSSGESEEILGKALIGRRDEVVLASKLFNPMGVDPNERGSSRRWIVMECERILRRLDTDHLDLLQIHRPSPNTDIDETLGALSDLVRAGKVLYVGTSTFPASQIVEAQWVAQQRNRERFVSEQPPYSILARSIEMDVLPTCQRHGVGVLTWSPLAGGWLSGRWRTGASEIISTRSQMIPSRYDLALPDNQRKLKAVDALASLAEEAGLSLVHLAIAWVIQNPAVTSAIVGPRTMDHFETQIGAAEVTLSQEILDRVDEIAQPGVTISPTDLGYVPPHVSDPSIRRRG